MVNEIVDVGIKILLAVILSLLAIFFGLLYKGIDRKLSARMQSRVGPPIRQPFRDVGKLMIKESIVPENAIPWLFNAAPVISLAASLLVVLYLPFIIDKPLLSGYGDAILVAYLFAIPALAMVAGGFASSSPFATVGAQREMVMMMSYEFSLAAVIISFAWRLSVAYPDAPVFSLAFISSHPIWNIIGPLGKVGVLILLIIIIIVMPAEIGKVPFDVPEAETEIAGGLLVEYSGRNLAMFYLADSVRMIAFATFIVAFFFPYNLSPFVAEKFAISLHKYIAWTVDILFFLLKIFLITFFAITFIRTTMARLKIDQVSHLYWVKMLAISVIALLLLYLDTYMGW